MGTGAPPVQGYGGTAAPGCPSRAQLGGHLWSQQLGTRYRRSGREGFGFKKIQVFSSQLEGNQRPFSFYEVEANLAWIHSLPPSAMCLRPTEIEGSVARDDLASRLRFPNQILCVVTGKDDAEVFCFAGLVERRCPSNLQSRFPEQICVILRTI